MYLEQLLQIVVLAVVFIIGKLLQIQERKIKLKLGLHHQKVLTLIVHFVIIHSDGLIMVFYLFYFRTSTVKTWIKCNWSCLWKKI